MPDTVTVREIRVKVSTRGCRVKEFVVATTLVDEVAQPKDASADLYHERWHVERDLGTSKSYRGMECLRCTTPTMARKEVWLHRLAYNLVRQVQAQAAPQHGTTPRSLRFAGTLQALHACRWVLLLVPAQRALLLGCLLTVVAQHRVGDRPDRCAPRQVKRRWKRYRLLKKRRAEERAALLG